MKAIEDVINDECVGSRGSSLLVVMTSQVSSWWVVVSLFRQ